LGPASTRTGFSHRNLGAGPPKARADLRSSRKRSKLALTRMGSPRSSVEKTIVPRWRAKNNPGPCLTAAAPVENFLIFFFFVKKSPSSGRNNATFIRGFPRGGGEKIFGGGGAGGGRQIGGYKGPWARAPELVNAASGLSLSWPSFRFPRPEFSQPKAVFRSPLMNREGRILAIGLGKNPPPSTDEPMAGYWRWKSRSVSPHKEFFGRMARSRVHAQGLVCCGLVCARG